MGQQSTPDRDRTKKVGLHLLAELIVGYLLQCAQKSVPGVVHQHIYLTERGDGGLDSGRYRRGVRYVERNRPRPSGSELLKRDDLLLSPYASHHPASARERNLRNSAPEAGRYTRDEPYPIFGAISLS